MLHENIKLVDVLKNIIIIILILITIIIIIIINISNSNKKNEARFATIYSFSPDDKSDDFFSH